MHLWYYRTFKYTPAVIVSVKAIWSMKYAAGGFYVARNGVYTGYVQVLVSVRFPSSFENMELMLEVMACGV